MESNIRPAMIVSTYPDMRTIKDIAKSLVEERLCACVNIIPITSVYRWQSAIQDTPEYLGIFKTTSAKLSALRERVSETHPYDVPEIAELDMVSLNESYLKWLIES